MKKINGTWFEFRHFGVPEGKYFNPFLMTFTPEQWVAMIEDIAGLGMEYLVLMCSALDVKTFYKSELFEEYPITCKNLLGLTLETCDRLNLKAFVSNDCVGAWQYPDNMITDPEICRRRAAITEEIAGLFGHHKSFYGWYWTNEAEIYPYYKEEFIKYVNINSEMAHRLTPGKKTLIAPYGTFRVKTDDTYLDQLSRLDVDIIAYQDEIGVRKSNIEWTPKYFESLRKAHDKVGRSKIWADMEVFQFEGPIYTSALLPAPFERIKAQLHGIQDFVDEVMIFEYPGLFSRPGSIASMGKSQEKLYTDYKAYLDSIKDQL